MRCLTRVISILAVAASVACSGASEGAPDREPDREQGRLDGSITVFAAASLTDAFTELADEFEAEHAGVSIRLNFAGSSALREQILAGAPSDVFASANLSNMERLVEAGAVTAPATFVTNALQIVVPAGNPARIAGLDDFADPDLLIGLCAVEVPCGEFARDVLDAAGVVASPDTEEPDVRALLTKVEADELDAGIVYVTDVVGAGDGVEGIAIPDASNVVAEYPIAATTDAAAPDVADAFIDFVRSSDGRRILDRYGFGRP